MKNKIYPCLWFDGKAKQAADFYGSVFNSSAITSENPMVVMFEIEGTKLMGLNGGPMFTINPAISFFVTCTTNEEAENLYKKLMDGGSALMPLGEYAWSKKYAWVKDKFGVTWQLMLGELTGGSTQKVTPSFLFSNKQYGHAKQAVEFYTSVFPESSVVSLQLYAAGEQQAEGNVKFANFKLGQQPFTAMDGPGDHHFDFNEGVSLVVDCDTQEQIDFYWNTLTKDGGEESMCGWLKDKFGVSWQIVPSMLGKLMSDPERGQRAMQALMKMKKLDIEALANA